MKIDKTHFELNGYLVLPNIVPKSTLIKINKNEISDEDILELAIEAGANECKSDREFHEIQCSINDIYNVKRELEKKISNFISTEIEWVPLNAIEISVEKKKELINFFSRSSGVFKHVKCHPPFLINDKLVYFLFEK